jgi:hypothetical protein
MPGPTGRSLADHAIDHRLGLAAEHVNGFTSDLEAKDWIGTQSQSWLKARTQRGNG